MISEVSFATDFTSFWRQLTPLMDGFVRQMNRGAYVRDSAPLRSEVVASRRAFVNEVAFQTYCRLQRSPGADQQGMLQAAIDAAASEAKSIARLGGWEGDASAVLQEAERSDVRQQILRLRDRLDKVGGSITCWPEFSGCGFVDSCKGDILADVTLVEVKAGERFFRAIDVRQVLTYLALNLACGAYSVSRVAIVNLRLGVSFEMSVDDLCFETSGRASSTLLDALIYAMSSGDISR